MDESEVIKQNKIMENVKQDLIKFDEDNFMEQQNDKMKQLPFINVGQVKPIITINTIDFLFPFFSATQSEKQ